MEKTLLSIGHGYSARALARVLIPLGWKIIGTTRSPGKAAELANEGVSPLIWPGSRLPIEKVTHLLTSVAPGESGDPVLAKAARELRNAENLIWVGYLSTTGVYGDRGGGWVDEASSLRPATKRGQARVEAEQAWQAMALPLHIFRLSGIYGPGRGPFEKVRNGTARRIVKEGQVFSRIHVDDIAQIVAASMRRPKPGAIYNLCDDDPAPPQDVIAFAAELLGLPSPPVVRFEDADLSPMARSFYSESKRVKNDRVKNDLGIELIHPTYRSGLKAVLDAES